MRTCLNCGSVMGLPQTPNVNVARCVACPPAVTQEQAERVLALFGEELTQRLGHPVPTGQQAAYHGLGPMLDMEWDGVWTPIKPTPTILLEGGISDHIDPDDYGIGGLAFCEAVQRRIDAEGLPVWLETYASYAVCIYPKE